MFKIGICGDTGMVGKELEKILQQHKLAQVVFRQNSQRTEGNITDCEIIFLATKEEESLHLAPAIFETGVKIIDMSGAFRLKNMHDFERWYGLWHDRPDLLQIAVYGLPAYFNDQIKNARLVANPGCYATAAILTLRPLEGIVNDINIVATSGNSGARKIIESPNELTYNYGRKHKHVPEIREYSNFDVDFTPIVLRSVFRGINMNIRAELIGKLKEAPPEIAASVIVSEIQRKYLPEDLVVVVQDATGKYGTSEVVNTHKLLINVLGVEDGKVFINTLIDNLGKGAASQAVENMNIMLRLPQLYGIGNTYLTK